MFTPGLMSFIIIPDDEYNNHIEEIMRMKPRKRKNWKAHNVWNGIRTVMKYENGIITDYMHGAQKRVPVKPVSYVKQVGMVKEPTTLRGKLMKEFLDDPNGIRDVEDYMASLWYTGKHTSRNKHVTAKKKAHAKPHKQKI